MFLTRSDYDRGINTFSPERRLFQVGYATEASKLGSTAIGVRVADGFVIAVEKRLTSPLLVSSSLEKIIEIDTHIGCAISGLTADARTLISHDGVETQAHRFTYDEPMDAEACTQAICDLALRFGEDGRDEDALSRPFGVALVIACVDENGPSLHHTDPSSTFVKWKAKATGAGSEGAQTTLQESYNSGITLQVVENFALCTLKQVMEEKLDGTNVELAAVTTEDSKFVSMTRRS